MTPAELLSRLVAVKKTSKGYEARCPAHEDSDPSLSIKVEDDRLLLHCHAGCDFDNVLAALDITARDLFSSNGDHRQNGHGPDDIVATYDYLDEDGQLLFQAVRKLGKRFAQRRPDSEGGWIWNLKGVRRVPYRLPQLIEAVGGGVSVWVCEGEKDVHALERAGAIATTCPMGAGKWDAAYNQFFKDAIVAVVADRDEPGHAHARHVARQLAGVAKSVELVEPAEGKDVSDHLAAGHGLEHLLALGDDGQAASNETGPAVSTNVRLMTGAEFLFGEAPSDDPLVGRDTEILHASGEATFVIAITGVGKSTYAQQYGVRRLGLTDSDFLGYPVRRLEDGEAILYVAADRPRQIRRSLRRMVDAAQAASLDRRLLVWKGPLPFQLNRDPIALADLVDTIEAQHDVTIREVILDSLKDVATELAKDEGGSAVAQAINHLVAVGREVNVLHHERKSERGAKKAPADIGDVYGSQFLTACAGNVIYLHGEPGGHVLSLHHLKQSADVVGPLELEYDHDSGALTVIAQKDLLALLRGMPRGMTIHTACLLLYGSSDPDKNMVARVYRKLERLTKAGLACREKPEGGLDRAAVYYPRIPVEAP